MTTGYEANFYRQFDVLTQSLRGIESALKVIANCMEANELRARQQGNQKTMVEALLPEGYKDMPLVEQLALLKAAERVLVPPMPTSVEDIEAMGEAVQAVRRGFADMEKQARDGK